MALEDMTDLAREILQNAPSDNSKHDESGAGDGITPLD